jgi:hypothetical protein
VGQQVAPAATAPRPAIISPLIDALCVGGLSLLLLLPLLLSGRADLVIVGVGMQAWIAALVNMPHFMASYRLVYRDRETINAHRWAAIYVPLILFGYIVFAVWQSRETDLYVSILMTVQGGYLAWHYTGQAWGMMATFTYLDGRSFQPVERRLIRGGLYLLLAWHVAWFFRWGFGNTRFAPLLESLYFILSVLSVVALVSGAVGLGLMKARTGRFPPAKALIAWGAIFVWYAAMARDPRAIFWVQIAHAVQYLMFPVRVEINRTRRSGSGRSRLATHMTVYLIVLLAVSVAMAVWIPARAMDVVADWLGRRPGEVTALSLLAFLNVHHYFTDGVMWKLRNPAVREDLFGHLAARERAVPAASGPPPGKSRRARRERRAG